MSIRRVKCQSFRYACYLKKRVFCLCKIKENNYYRRRTMDSERENLIWKPFVWCDVQGIRRRKLYCIACVRACIRGVVFRSVTLTPVYAPPCPTRSHRRVITITSALVLMNVRPLEMNELLYTLSFFPSLLQYPNRLSRSFWYRIFGCHENLFTDKLWVNSRN